MLKATTMLSNSDHKSTEKEEEFYQNSENIVLDEIEEVLFEKED